MAATGLTSVLMVAIPLIQRDLIDNVLIPARVDLLLPTVGLLALFWLVMSMTEVAASTLRSYLDERFLLQLRRELFTHCERLAIPFWHREHQGRIMALFMNDVPALVTFVGSGFVAGVGQMVSVVVSAAVMVHLSWQLALVAVSVPPLVGVVASLVSRPLRGRARRLQDKAEELTIGLHESMAGLREIVAFQQEGPQRRWLTAILRELLRQRMSLVFIGSAIGAGQNIYSLAVTLVLYGLGGYLVIQGETTVGTLVAFHAVHGLAYVPAKALIASGIRAQSVAASAERLYEVLDTRPEVQDRPDSREPVDVRGRVEFQNVSFEYVPGKLVLQDVSFETEPGSVVALVGPSGAGKTTLASLIARFYAPTHGRVLLDGKDLSELTLRGVRSHLGIVFQDPFLFATTVRENIAFGMNSATDDQIEAAARAACAWEFIQGLPQGLATLIGQRGVQLSEGQRQRLAIARALLRDPRILIMDEPTSALDARTEALLEEALGNLMQGRTTFVIAHRLATVRRADQILVLDGGRIVESGTHKTLMDGYGLYRELCDLQFGESPGLVAQNA
jgi:ABC-type multidrug transport system fused ATPase/permease subunit